MKAQILHLRKRRTSPKENRVPAPDFDHFNPGDWRQLEFPGDDN